LIPVWFLSREEEREGREGGGRGREGWRDGGGREGWGREEGIEGGGRDGGGKKGLREEGGMELWSPSSQLVT